MKKTNTGARGFTIIELMITMTLALIITAAVGLIFVSNQKTYKMSESISRQQESLRFATEIISYDLRMAGHFGCNSTISPADVPPSLSDLVQSVDPNLKYTNPIQGYTGGAVPVGLTVAELYQSIPGTPQDHVRSDVFRVQYASAQYWPVVTAMASANSTVEVTGKSGDFTTGNVLFIADCTKGDLFVASGASFDAGSKKFTLAHAGANNSSAAFSTAYDTSAEVMRYINRIYYIGSVGGRPTLLRKSLLVNPFTGTGTVLETEEVADGIAEMTVLYGEDTDGDEKVNLYRKANTVANWSSVLSARVCLLYEGTDTSVSEKTTATQYQSYIGCSGQTINATDKKYRQSTMFTVNLRNRVP